MIKDRMEDKKQLSSYAVELRGILARLASPYSRELFGLRDSLVQIGDATKDDRVLRLAEVSCTKAEAIELIKELGREVGFHGMKWKKRCPFCGEAFVVHTFDRGLLCNPAESALCTHIREEHNDMGMEKDLAEEMYKYKSM